jgi:hypothetical protein
MRVMVGLSTSKITTGSETTVLAFSPDVQVGIANVLVDRADLEVASVKPAQLASEAVSQRGRDIRLNVGVGARAARHRDRSDAVEFVAQGLPFLPCKEFSEGHGFTQREVHERL